MPKSVSVDSVCVCISEYVCAYLCVLCISQYMLNVHVLDIKSSL